MPEITTEIFANVIEPRKVREHSSCFATLLKMGAFLAKLVMK